MFNLIEKKDFSKLEVVF